MSLSFRLVKDLRLLSILISKPAADAFSVASLVCLHVQCSHTPALQQFVSLLLTHLPFAVGNNRLLCNMLERRVL